MSRYLALLHEIEEKTRLSRSDKTDEIDYGGFVRPQKAHENALSEPLRGCCWRLTGPDGARRIVHFSDSLTRAQVIEITGAAAADPAELPVLPASGPLSAAEEVVIRRALNAAGETDGSEIEAVVGACHLDQGAREYWLRRATPLPRLVQCGDCRHFRRYEDHPHLGGCAVGGPENAAGNWDDDCRLCGLHQRETA